MVITFHLSPTSILTIPFRLVAPASAPDPGYDSKLWAYHSYVSMYQDADAGLSGPVIVYNPGTMNKTMANNREFIIFYGDNQESNSFLAQHNVQKYLPGAYSSVVNETGMYPKPGPGNESYWYPQEVNTPLTNVNTSVAANFFPVSFSRSPNHYLLTQKQHRLTATSTPITQPLRCALTTPQSGILWIWVSTHMLLIGMVTMSCGITL
jgi:hypothetical protein